MKARIVLLALVVLLTTGGWDCFNEEIGVPVDVKFTTSYAINPGNNLNYSRTAVVSPKDSVDDNFQDKLTSGRIYDVQVRAVGTFGGSVAGMTTVNGTLLLTYSGKWSDFKEWQSLLGKSTFITPNKAGLDTVSSILKRIDSRPLVTLTGSGSVSGATSVPAGLSVEFRILGQADAIVN